MEINKEILELAVQGKVILINCRGDEIKKLCRNDDNSYPYRCINNNWIYGVSDNGLFIINDKSNLDIVSYRYVDELNKYNVTKPSDMKFDDNLEMVIEKIEAKLKLEPKGKEYYSITIEGLYSDDLYNEVEDIYLNAGWENVECFNKGTYIKIELFL